MKRYTIKKKKERKRKRTQQSSERPKNERKQNMPHIPKPVPPGRVCLRYAMRPESASDTKKRKL
jgi:hypothetical protein